MLSFKWFLLCAFAIAGVAAQPAARTAASGDILLLTTDAPNRTLYNELVSGLSDELYRARISSSIEVIDVRPILSGQAEADRERVNRFHLSLGNRRFRIVIAFGAEALDFLLRVRGQLWPDAAVIATAVTAEQFAAYRNVRGLTAVTVDPPFGEQVRLIFRLFPGTRNVAIVAGSGGLDQAAYEVTRREVVRLAGGVNIIELAGLRWDELVEKVSALPPDTAIVATSILRDADGRILPRAMVNELSKRAKAPVFAGGEAFGAGAIGGWGYDLGGIGREVATVARQILDGGAGEVPPKASAAFRARIDWRQLRRWKIPEGRVPPEVRITNRPLPVWRSHPLDTMAAVLGLLSEMVLIVLLLRDRRTKIKLRREAEEHARFEALVAELTSWFITVPPEGLDERIEAALERLAAAVGATAACLYGEKSGELTLTHAWPARDGAPPRPQAAAPGRTSIRIVGREREAGVLEFAVGEAAIEAVRGRLGGLRTMGMAFLGALSRRQALLALEASQSLSSAILRSLRVYLVVVDGDGNVVRADGRSYLTTEEQDRFPFPAVSPGQNFEQLLASTGADHPDCAMVVESIRVARMEAKHSTLEVRYSGEERGRWVGTQIYPFDRVPGGAILVFYDMTAPKRLEAEYHAQFLELSHMERVAALGQLASALAHELNQPLAAILANAQASLRLLRRPAPDLTEAGAAIQDVVADVKRAADVIAQMRALLRKEPVPAEPADAGAIADRMVGLMRAEASSRNVVLVYQPPTRPLLVHCNAVQIGQVLLNLILNALDAVSQSEPELRVVIAGVRELPDDGLIEIWVRDYGPGLPPEAAARVFEPFQTTKEGGLGVGLSICRSIVEQHGGTIQVASAEGGGAVFSVRLPAVPADRTIAAVQEEHA
jgi:signal transduction histidine kinase